MDSVSLLWGSLFNQLPNELERELMSPLVKMGIDESLLCLYAIHIHVILERDGLTQALARDMQKSFEQLHDLMPVMATGIEATITRVQQLEANARYTEHVLAKAANTMDKIDDGNSFWRRLTTAAPLAGDRAWFLAAIMFVAMGGALLGSAGTILALFA